MQRLSTKLHGVSWSDGTRRLARWLNPVVASPAAPLEAFAALDARGAVVDAADLAAGGGVDGAERAGGAGERRGGGAADQDGGAGRGADWSAAGGPGGGRWGGAGAGGAAERDGERLWTASARTAGRLLRAGAAGGALHDLGGYIQGRYPAQRAVRPVVVSAALWAGLLYWGARRLAAREAAVQRWPLPQTTTLPATLATSYAVTAVGTGLTRGYVFTRGALESYFGPGPGKRLVARLVNAGVWAAAATGAYNAGVAYIGRANEKVEPAYATPPASALVSGSDDSLLPFADLGQQGRRYVTDVVTPELIER